ncbi:HXXEE domain-containing protein [Falsibacillus pallidus]|uniref:Uncharacterized protein with HXXEE motif n=1 Tax=Falsibacillus pallidus TaxID=493781 RepID=A0A370GB16_9BACI|nr:HXXEE domain-containing protein [Falsibacillus pallidus]RDI40948.1 uncharacterized protein with HXXEE motif [Falsibacillus pallidus]
MGYKTTLSSSVDGGVFITQWTVLLIWLFPIIFAIHDFEEIVVVEKWIGRNRKDLHERLPKKAIFYFEKNFAKKTNQFSLVVFVEFVVISLSTILLYLEGFQGWCKWLYLGLMSVFVLHSLTHIGQAILLKRYTPGIITSVVLIIPYGLVFYRTLLEAGTINIADIWMSIPVGIVVFMLFFPATMKAASKY